MLLFVGNVSGCATIENSDPELSRLRSIKECFTELTGREIEERRNE
jgi:hypothetical protein